jgi:hypothetical protein
MARPSKLTPDVIKRIGENIALATDFVKTSSWK